MMGVHQKIDRVAHRHLKKHVPAAIKFPTIREVLHFEGLHGPDGIKRKSPAKDEPWHYIDPANPKDRGLITMINNHIFNLAHALAASNNERAAFEAAWLSHAIVDGLTPAHHYPLEAKLEELRGGAGLETRITTKDKLLLPGTNRRHQLRNNWEYWGTKGVFTTHLNFELGVASTIAPLRFDDATLTDDEREYAQREGFEAVFYRALQRVVDLQMYEEFTRLGWTQQIARETRSVLLPEIIKTVTLAWYISTLQAERAL